jgi:hypothetical protein
MTAGSGITAGATAPKPNSISQLFGSGPDQGLTFGNVGNALGANAGLLVSGAGLANDISTALSGPPKGTNQLTQEAQQLQAQAATNEGYLSSGTLPPGVQAGINQATQSAIAAVKSRYASEGMSGSSAEQQDIQSIQTNAAVNGSNIAMQLLNSGVSEAGLSANIYQGLIQNTMASDQAFSSAFTGLALAAGGGGGGATFKLAAA